MPVEVYIYDGDTVLEVTDETGVVLKEYTTTGGRHGDILSEFDGTSTRFFEPDGLGSTSALTDESQTVVDQWKYQAFGLSIQTIGTDENPFTWLGRHAYYSDVQTSLYLLGSGTRYFDPATARFLSRDPVGFSGGDANLYRYVANNPTNELDPSGLGTGTWSYLCASTAAVCVGICTCTDPGQAGWLLTLSMTLLEKACCNVSCFCGNFNPAAQPGAMMGCLQRLLRAAMGAGVTCNCN